MLKITKGGAKSREDQAKQVWSVVRTKADWDALTVAARWEIVRRVIVYLLKKEFRDLGE
jgi:hypothetical protein